MQDATRAQLCLTTLCELTAPELLVRLWPIVLRIGRLVQQFRRQPVSDLSESLFGPGSVCVGVEDASPRGLDGVFPLPPTADTDREWCDRSRLQDRVHSALQTSGHEVEHHRRPADPGPPRAGSEPPLVNSPHRDAGSAQRAATSNPSQLRINTHQYRSIKPGTRRIAPSSRPTSAKASPPSR